MGVRVDGHDGEKWDLEEITYGKLLEIRDETIKSVASSMEGSSYWQHQLDEINGELRGRVLDAGFGVVPIPATDSPAERMAKLVSILTGMTLEELDELGGFGTDEVYGPNGPLPYGRCDQCGTPSPCADHETD